MLYYILEYQVRYRYVVSMVCGKGRDRKLHTHAQLTLVSLPRSPSLLFNCALASCNIYSSRALINYYTKEI